MSYHLAFGKNTDLEKIRQEARSGASPGHVMADLAERLSAQVHFPGGRAVTRGDALRSRICSTADHWALARELAARVQPQDVIYCTGEDVGIPVATACAGQRHPPKIALFTHNVDRLRARAAFGFFRCAPAISAWLTNARYQYRFLEQHLRIPSGRVHWIAEQTDTRFFTPGPAALQKKRPVVVSVGLEQRDYRTLARATENLDVEVQISGFSRDAKALRHAFPDTLPSNMARRFYSWPDLVQLYRDADVVAVSLFDNKYCAGLTTFLEAAACRRPAVVARTRGLAEYIDPAGIALPVEPGDAGAMRAAIERILASPQLAEDLADKAYRHITAQHNSEAWIDAVARVLESLQGNTQATVAAAR